MEKSEKTMFVGKQALAGRGVRRYRVKMFGLGRSSGVPNAISAFACSEGLVSLGSRYEPIPAERANRPGELRLLSTSHRMVYEWPIYAATEADAKEAYKKILGITSTAGETWDIVDEGPAPDEIPESVLKNPFFHPDAWRADQPLAAENRRIALERRPITPPTSSLLYGRESPLEAAVPVAAPASLYDTKPEAAEKAKKAR